MWYENRWTTDNNPGYAINVATSPMGPFKPYASSVELPGKGRIGDYDLFVDDDGTAYHVRTGITIVQLNSSRTGPTGKVGELPNGGVEGPAMFKRNGAYFILAGKGCCACFGGSNIEVYRSAAPLGPYAYIGDVGSRLAPFNPFSPNNYVTKAQQTKVFLVPAADGSIQYVWLGNQWVTSKLPGRPRNNDLLYWNVLEWLENNTISKFEYSDHCALSVK